MKLRALFRSNLALWDHVIWVADWGFRHFGLDLSHVNGDCFSWVKGRQGRPGPVSVAVMLGIFNGAKAC